MQQRTGFVYMPRDFGLGKQYRLRRFCLWRVMRWQLQHLLQCGISVSRMLLLLRSAELGKIEQQFGKMRVLRLFMVPAALLTTLVLEVVAGSGLHSC
jgi:hypothetical protein